MSQELKRILYVEDDDLIAEVAIMILEDLGGFEVKHCVSGHDAVEEFPKFKPQLILIDVMMPGITGVETIETIKKTKGYSGEPFVFMTAKIQTNEQDAYIKMGAAGVIAKPFHSGTLCTTIKELWQKFHG